MMLEHKILKSCLCGKMIEVFISRHKDGRGKYCSKKCMYKYRKRPSGLIYKFKKENSGRFKKGELFKNQLHKLNRNKYARLHIWINKNKKKSGICKKCNNTKKTQWANVSRKYLKNINDWAELCSSCHRKYDFNRKDSSWLTA